MNTFCPVTGCKVYSRPEWINRKASDTFVTNFWIIGDSIIYSLPKGRADIEGVQKSLELKMEVAKHVSDGNGPYVQIQDYSELNGSTHAGRRSFIKNANEDERLVSMIFCNLSAPSSIAVKIGNRFNTANKIIQIAMHYTDAVKLALELVKPQKMTPVVYGLKLKKCFKTNDHSLSPIELVSDDAWTIKTPTFNNRMIIINRHILYSISNGYFEPKNIKQMNKRRELCQQAIPEGSRIDCMIVDSSKLSGSTRSARIGYMKSIKDWHQKYPLKMYIVHNANMFMRTAVQLAKLLMPFPVKIAKDLSHALRLISDYGSRVLTQKHRIRESETPAGVTNKDIEKLLSLIGSINWEQGGIDDSLDIGMDHPFYLLYQSLKLVKEELDDLLIERKSQEELQSVQLRLIEYAPNHTVQELLQKILDEAEVFTNSEIGFFHFVQDDQNTLLFQAWSTNTPDNRCPADGVQHYHPVYDAAVWADCLQGHRPVVNNDYARLMHRNQMPGGHMPIVRKLVVPVIRGEKTIAILEVGNKRVDYIEQDVEVLQQFADLAWETVVRKQAEEKIEKSEKFLNTIIENIPNMIFVKDVKELRFVRFNKAGEDLLGYTRKNIIGKNDYDLFPENAADAFIEKDRETLEQGVVFDIPEELIQTKFKGDRILHTKKIPILNENGKAEYLLGISEDITERKKAELELKNYREHLEELVEEQTSSIKAIVKTAADGIITIDSHGIVLAFNPAAETMFSYSAKEVIGHNISMLMGSFHKELHDSYLKKYFKTGVPHILGSGIETEGQKKNGTIFPVHLAVSEMTIGKEKRFAGILRDITTQKETQAQLIQTSKLASIGELAAGVAHELNQPLMIMRMASQMNARNMKNNKFSIENTMELQDTIERNTTRMMKIINHLRTFSRQSNSGFVPVDINKIIEDCFLMIGEQIRLQNIKVKKDLSPGIFKIHGDANQLEQVFLNLISNARDAIQSRSKVKETANTFQGKIYISTAVRNNDQDTVEIQIKDNGCGIPEDARQDIFNPFFTTKEVGKGTGLGLSISYGIIQDHKGKIDVFKTGPGGTTFRIQLPVSKTIIHDR